MTLFELLKRPESYDISGIFVFLLLIIVSIWSLRSRKVLPVWLSVILLVIGALGVIIDGTIVYIKFLS